MHFFFFSLCSALKNQGFEIIERGEIEVKVKGKMTTYFLIQTLNAAEDKIMGRSKTPLDHKGKQKREALPLVLSSFSTNYLRYV